MSPTGTLPHTADLAISGMTCASCSARIEKKLNKMDGVEASVNLATEKAQIRYADPVTVADLIATVERTGHGAAPLEADAPMTTADGHRTDPWRLRAILCAILTVPVAVIGMSHGLHLPYGGWIEFALATPVALWGAWPFHRAAAINARHATSTMDTLVSLGVLAAYLWSSVTLFTVGEMGQLYFETSAVVTTFLLIGRWLEARAKSQGRSALEELMHLGAKDVLVRREGTDGSTAERRIPVEELRVADIFIALPGDKIATDAVVVEGHSAIDTSAVTGEPIPVEVGPGEPVTGGTINGHGRLVLRATRVGRDTTLAGIARLVEQAQTGKADVQRLADRVSAVFVPTVLSLALVTFIGWWIATGSAARALGVAVAVLVIACPCALGLATPTALLAGTARGARLGILVKGPQVLESTQRIDTIVLDKTGTITTGRPTLTSIVTADDVSEDEALAIAAAVESASEHPIAHAIVTAAHERGVALAPVAAGRALAGAGAQAEVVGDTVTIGKPSLFDSVPEHLRASGHSGTTVFVGRGGRAFAALTVSDAVRDTSARAIAELRQLGLTPYLLTGDNARSAREVAADVGIAAEHVIADVLPEDKFAVVSRLQGEGRRVAMAGDGVNDAAALAQADLGLAMGSGTDVAMSSADIVLMRAELPAVADAIRLSRATLRVIKQNLGWAFGYNTAAIPLAMAGLLNPMIAGGAMAMSSVLVVTNSLRLRRAVTRSDKTT